MDNFIELVPNASNLIESQRSIGYTFQTAVADIVDNSISAMAKKISINFNAGNENHEAYVAVNDDGTGMSKSELLDAMKYGSKSSLDVRDRDDLGRFGLGLKMASFSQCRKLTVLSKKDGQVNACQWDLDMISAKQSWICKVLGPKEIENLPLSYELAESGTSVIWQNFDKLVQTENFGPIFDELLDNTQDHLALVFHRYLSEEGVRIFANGRKLEAVDPYFTQNKATQPLEEEYIRFANKNIIVKPYIVPYQKKLSQSERLIMRKYSDLGLNQGLYIYRNKRLIAWGKWFRIIKTNELANLAKIRVDIPNSMDSSWNIDVKKSTLSVPPALRDEIRTIITRTVGKSERVYKHRGSLRNRDNLFHVFDRYEKEKQISYQINRKNPLILQLQENLSDIDKRLLENLLQDVEQNIPFETIRYDMASEKEVTKTSISDDESYEQIMTLLSLQVTKENKKSLLEALKYSDAYQDKKGIIERIEGELDD